MIPAAQDPFGIRVGDVIAGKYRVERVLGAGGMGAVVAAWHVDLEQRVAIKLMLRHLAQHDESVTRFLREAKASVRLRSEHVGRVFDVGRLETGEPYMVMEYLEGADLSLVLGEHGPLPLADAVDLFCQACEGIAEAHAQGIIHRDLKPANLFLTRDAHGQPLVKVLDFGISKARSPGEGSTAGLTGSQAVLGTPMYMAPEQMRATKQADARSDLWSLGAILFELLTARVAFDGDSITEIIARVLTEEPPRVRQYRPDIPEAVERAILRCVEQDPSARFQTVSALVGAIAPYGTARARLCSDRLLSATLGAQPTELAPSPPARLQASPNTDASWNHGQTGVPLDTDRRSTRVGWILAGLGVACMLVGIGSWMGSRTRGSGATSAQPARSLSASSIPAPSASSLVAGETTRPDSQTPSPAFEAASAEPDASGAPVSIRDLRRRLDAHDAGGAKIVSSATPANDQAELTKPGPAPQSSKTQGPRDYGGRE